MTDPTISELHEAAHCVLAWIDRKTDTGRLAAERLERALAGVREEENSGLGVEQRESL